MKMFSKILIKSLIIVFILNNNVFLYSVEARQLDECEDKCRSNNTWKNWILSKFTSTPSFIQCINKCRKEHVDKLSKWNSIPPELHSDEEYLEEWEKQRICDEKIRMHRLRDHASVNPTCVHQANQTRHNSNTNLYRVYPPDILLPICFHRPSRFEEDEYECNSAQKRIYLTYIQALKKCIKDSQEKKNTAK